MMNSRRDFLKKTSVLAAGSFAFNQLLAMRPIAVEPVGIQLYTVRTEMLADAVGTLKQLAQIGFKELESAGSGKGNYYGLAPLEIKKITEDLGMTLRSGHVHMDDQWQQSLDAATETGQQYLVCSSLPSAGQTADNYKKCAEIFNNAAEDCRKRNIIFAYHNHDAEFEKDNGKLLYDVLLEETDPALVKMEMDIGWLMLAGYDPFDYFSKYPGRFPLWHLKDMDKAQRKSTEFGKGVVDIPRLLQNATGAGLQFFFLEQEEYAHSAMQSIRFDYDYLQDLKK